MHQCSLSTVLLSRQALSTDARPSASYILVETTVRAFAFFSSLKIFATRHSTQTVSLVWLSPAYGLPLPDRALSFASIRHCCRIAVARCLVEGIALACSIGERCRRHRGRSLDWRPSLTASSRRLRVHSAGALFPTIRIRLDCTCSACLSNNIVGERDQCSYRCAQHRAHTACLCQTGSLVCLYTTLLAYCRRSLPCRRNCPCL